MLELALDMYWSALWSQKQGYREKKLVHQPIPLSLDCGSVELGLIRGLKSPGFI